MLSTNEGQRGVCALRIEESRPRLGQKPMAITSAAQADDQCSFQQ